MQAEERYTTTPKLEVKMGHGLGTVIDAGFPVASKYKAVEFLDRARAGQRLLITGNTHKEIKHMESVIKGAAKSLGLTLQWRFGREVRLVPRYIHPEWIEVREVEYQAWVLVKARAVVNPTSDQKNQWLVESVLGQLDRDEEEQGEVPSWVWEMGAEDLGHPEPYTEEHKQRLRNKWAAQEQETLTGLDLDDPEKLTVTLDEEI